MSTMPSRYEPEKRLVDDPDELERLYCEKDLTIRQIANKHAEMGRSKVASALNDFGIIDDDSPQTDSTRGIDPPTTEEPSVDWSIVS